MSDQPERPITIRDLDIKVDIYDNPWEHRVPQQALFMLLDHAAHAVRLRIVRIYNNTEYEKAKLAIAVLDPTAPAYVDSSDTLLATVCIGPAEANIENAFAKACMLRDLGGLNPGLFAHRGPDSMYLHDGSFRYGDAAVVDRTFVGASGLKEAQDRREATVFGAEFNYGVGEVCAEWAVEHPGGKWYCDQDLPGRRYANEALPFPLFSGINADAVDSFEEHERRQAELQGGTK